MIQVVNMKALGSRPMQAPLGTVRRRIDRKSPLGNPFHMKDYSQKERDRVCDEYEKWFPRALLSEGVELDYFNELLSLAKTGSNLELICHCAPLRCHGDTIKRKLEEALSEQWNLE